MDLDKIVEITILSPKNNKKFYYLLNNESALYKALEVFDMQSKVDYYFFLKMCKLYGTKQNYTFAITLETILKTTNFVI